MEQSLHFIRQLIADFKANEQAFLSPTYQESQVRQDFIDKFFTALGWDVTHTTQKNPYEQEVKIENKVTTQGSQRRADYAFFVAPNYRDVKFFAEAKKPAHNLVNADYYYQTLRYGWNAGTPIAILTDFEGFHILDCRYKPDIGDALNRKLKYFHYSDYADEEKFKEIFFLFGREAVANGSIEKFAADLPKPKSKTLRGFRTLEGLKTVDEDFLEVLDEYRNTLAKAFKKENQELDGEELTEAVQRTLDRLVFIRFLEDKGIEEPEIIKMSSPLIPQKARDANNAQGGRIKEGVVWNQFISLCKRFEPKYNGLIFKPHRILDGKDFHPPDDKAFADICAELADPSSPYDFDKIPISILGSIYERFLGKVVHATAKQVKVEPKPEVRKAGGVYYTPEYIVRYIVNETVGRLLYGEPFEGSKPSKGFTGSGKSPDEIAKMSFADIACGSGSFLIEVYNQLLEYHERWYNAHRDKAKKEDVHERDGRLHLSLKKKKEILTNNVYGVDIDFQAIEVTQLSLYLKLLENVTNSETHQLGMFKETILPDLRNNIVCGNSLIGTDIYDGDLFESQNLVKVRNLDKVEQSDKLRPMNFEDAFPKIMKKGGFDAVVGNPPYRVIGKEDGENNFSDYLRSKFSSFQYKVDLYHLFIERAITLLKLKGKLGYITPNTWFTLQFTDKLRNFVLNNSLLEKLLIFNHKVFNAANVDTAITILTRYGNREAKNDVLVWIFPKDFSVEMISTLPAQSFAQEKWKQDELSRFETRISFGLEKLLSKTKSNTKELGVIVRASLGTQAYNSSKHTKEQITKRVFHSTKKLSKEYLPELSGNDVGRYTLQWQKKEFIKYGFWLHDYRTMEWLEGPRILVREITGKNSYKICSTYVEETYCNYKTILNIIYGEDKSFSLKYLLGILNSRLISFVYPLVSNKIVKDNFPRISVGDLRLLPIRTINFDDVKDKSRHDNIVKLVEQMLEAKQKLSAAKNDGEANRLELLCASLDRKIDEAVYELYGLTEEDIKVVEGENV